MGRLVALALLVAIGGPAMAYEEPRYEVVERREGFELRRYAPQLVAETRVTGEFDEVGSRAFRILAGYISGANRPQARIAMTAPVTQAPESKSGEEIAMTAPVTQTSETEDGAQAYTFAFVMPSEYTRDTLPEPTDPRVRIREVPARLVAVRRYSGGWSEARYEREERALLEAIAGAGLVLRGQPEFARYNSPFSLWFLRRNEVWVEVQSARNS